ncbi:MAG: hypothetical protein GQ477_02240 [Nanohaloarchaea archaeon]|nr:hypothetical protein [Candidatus Nanohaloarchaea archaeon]
MDDTDVKLLYGRMAELNINIAKLGKDINGLNKTQKELSSRIEKLPKEVFNAASDVSSKTSLDELRTIISEVSMTSNDIQRTVDTIFESFTRDKAVK